MQLEDYFEFEKFDTSFGPVDRIRIKGHRIAIEHVVDLYCCGVTADEIWRTHYPTLTPDEVYATLTYYLRNKAEVDAYIQRGREVEKAVIADFMKREPSPAQKRIQAIKAELVAQGFEKP